MTVAPATAQADLSPHLRAPAAETPLPVSTPPVTTFVPDSPPSPQLVAQPLRMAEVLAVTAQLAPREKVFVYASVFAKAPRRALEIGVSQGLSSVIIAGALRDLGRGRLIGVDPEPQPVFDYAATLGDVAELLTGPSPRALPEAARRAGGPFEWVFVDGDHSYEGVIADLKGLVDVTASGAVILCHDAYFKPVRTAIDDALAAGLPYLDAGMVCTTESPGLEYGKRVSFCGLRQLIRL